MTKKLSSVFIVLFFLSVALAAYFLYLLPEQLSQSSSAVDIYVIEELLPVLNQLYAVVGGTILLGLITTTLLFVNWYSSQSATASAIKKQERSIQEEGEEEQEEETVVIAPEAVEALLASDDTSDECFRKALSLVCKELEASQAAAYVAVEDEDIHYIELLASFAYHVPEGERVRYRFGEGLAGQVAKEGHLVNVKAVPEGYIRVLSGLGSATPGHLLILPVKEGDQLLGVVEIASFHAFRPAHELALQQVFDKLALKLSNVDNVSLENAKR